MAAIQNSQWWGWINGFISDESKENRLGYLLLFRSNFNLGHFLDEMKHILNREILPAKQRGLYGRCRGWWRLHKIGHIGTIHQFFGGKGYQNRAWSPCHSPLDSMRRVCSMLTWISYRNGPDSYRDCSCSSLSPPSPRLLVPWITKHPPVSTSFLHNWTMNWHLKQINLTKLLAMWSARVHSTNPTIMITSSIDPSSLSKDIIRNHEVIGLWQQGTSAYNFKYFYVGYAWGKWFFFCFFFGRKQFNHNIDIDSFDLKKHVMEMGEICDGWKHINFLELLDFQIQCWHIISCVPNFPILES